MKAALIFGGILIALIFLQMALIHATCKMTGLSYIVFNGNTVSCK